MFNLQAYYGWNQPQEQYLLINALETLELLQFRLYDSEVADNSSALSYQDPTCCKAVILSLTHGYQNYERTD